MSAHFCIGIIVIAIIEDRTIVAGEDDQGVLQNTGRFQSSNQNKSDNYNAYLSYSKLPAIGGRINLSFNRNESNYLKSQIISVRHSRDLIKKKLSADLYFRMVNYTYTYAGASEGSNTQTKQYYTGANLMYRFSRTLTFSVMGFRTGS